MLPSELLICRQNGESTIPKKIPLNEEMLSLAMEHIYCFEECIGKTSGELQRNLNELEG